MNSTISYILILSAFFWIFEPGVCQEPLKIMPMGNSITYDNNVADRENPRPDDDRIAYRCKLYQLLNQEGYTFDFVGNRISGSAYFPDPENAGFPGIETSGLLNLIKTGYNNFEKKYELPAYPGNYLMNYQPDVILLHIGTNGLQDSTDAEIFANDVNQILNEVDVAESSIEKNISVFLAQIINRTPVHQPTTAYNKKLAKLVQSRYNDLIKLVDIEKGAGIVYDLEPFGDMADTWHPNKTGYDKMAEQWFQALEDYNLMPPNIMEIPIQEINDNGYFDTLYLDKLVYDPQERDEEITWEVIDTAFLHFEYVLTDDRKLIVKTIDSQWQGTENLTVKATDPEKGEVSYTSEANIAFKAGTVGLKTVGFADHLIQRFYPVPAVNEISFHFNSEMLKKDAVLHIYSVNGNLIETFVLNDSGKLKIDINNYNKGLYLFNLVNGSIHQPGKFIKK